MTSRLARFSFIGFFSFSFLLVSLPLPSDAALVPCGRSSGTAAEMAPCTVCHLVLGGKGVIDWGLRVMTYIAIAVIVAMGIMYIVSAGDEGMMKTAKGGIVASLVGFAVMLGAWLIVNTVITILAVDESAGKPLSGLRSSGAFTFTCDTASKVNVSPSASSQTSSGNASSGNTPAAASGTSDMYTPPDP